MTKTLETFLDWLDMQLDRKPVQVSTVALWTVFFLTCVLIGLLR